MNVSLTTQLEAFVHEQVDGGRYQNASEVVRSALRLMSEREEERGHQLAWMRSQIDQGWKDAEGGRLVSAEEVSGSMAVLKEKRSCESGG